MEPRKQAILAALDKFTRQRPGLEFGNYGDLSAFRSEMRGITRDLHHYRELERYVTWRDSITADMLLEAARSAYSGRLTLNDIRATYADGSIYHNFSVDYCTGQYWPTEYRRAACAVLASAIWAAMRDEMPAPREPRLVRTHGSFTSEHDNIEGKTPGDWLRSKARREFGRGIASRWFS
jgi:hypothetical protein